MTTNSKDDAQNNPAVMRCCEAYNRAYERAYANNLAALQEQDEEIDDEEDAADAAEDAVDDAVRAARCAYGRALPPLIGVRNIRNFIACVTYGSTTGAIDGTDYSRLLYAAQVAYATRRTRSPKSGKDAKKSQSGANKGAMKAMQEPSPAPIQPASPILP